MARAPIPCIEHRCPEYSLPGKSRCRQHQTEFEGQRRRNPNLTGRRGTSRSWATAREKALRRAGHRCERCGRTAHGLRDLKRKLVVHHKDGDSKNNAQANLRVLCGSDRGSCHWLEHHAGKLLI